MPDIIKMYTYIKDRKLYILLPNSGRVFQVREGFDGQYPELIIDRIIQYHSEVEELIKETNAQSIE